jgi:hypothetical protein
LVSVAVERGSPESGGYVLAMQLSNGNMRLAATQHPGKYLSAWKHSVRQYGAPEVTRVYVSKLYIRYEPIKPPMAISNSPTCGHPKFPQARRRDYAGSGFMASRAAASLSR